MIRATPLSESGIAAIIAQGEGKRIEFKRQWHDLKQSNDKAEFVKDIIALANMTAPDEPSYLIFGIDDLRHGGGVVSVNSPPSDETISQVLADCTQPPISPRCERPTYRGEN